MQWGQGHCAVRGPRTLCSEGPRTMSLSAQCKLVQKQTKDYFAAVSELFFFWGGVSILCVNILSFSMLYFPCEYDILRVKNNLRVTSILMPKILHKWQAFLHLNDRHNPLFMELCSTNMVSHCILQVVN